MEKEGEVQSLRETQPTVADFADGKKGPWAKEFEEANSPQMTASKEMGISVV